MTKYVVKEITDIKLIDSKTGEVLLELKGLTVNEFGEVKFNIVKSEKEKLK